MLASALLLTRLLASTPLALMPAAPKKAAGYEVASLVTKAPICAADSAFTASAPEASMRVSSSQALARAGFSAVRYDEPSRVSMAL